MTKKTDITCGNGMPGTGHRRNIIKHMALRLIDGSEIRHDFGRLHNNFAQKKRARADNFCRHTHDPDKCVDLRQIPAVRAEPLPDVRNRIETDDINAVIAEEKHIGRHVIEDCGITVIKIPLIGIKSRHHDLSRLLTPGKITGCRLREDLRNSLFKFVRDVPVIKEEVSRLAFRIPSLGFPRPLMILTCMVHDKIKAYAHSAAVAFLRKIRKVLHRTELRLDTAEIRYRIASVAASPWTLKKRHQMKIIDPALFQVIYMAFHALEIPGKSIRIHQHTQYVISFIPVRDVKTHLVPFL